jgi:hypothetical protein
MTRLIRTGMIAWLFAASAAAQPRVVDPARGSTIAAIIERAVARDPPLRAVRLAVEAAEPAWVRLWSAVIFDGSK